MINFVSLFIRYEFKIDEVYTYTFFLHTPLRVFDDISHAHDQLIKSVSKVVGNELYIILNDRHH